MEHSETPRTICGWWVILSADTNNHHGKIGLAAPLPWGNGNAWSRIVRLAIPKGTGRLVAVASVTVVALMLAWPSGSPSLPPGRWRVDVDLAAEMDRTLRFHFPEYDLRNPTLDSLMNLEARWQEFDEGRARFQSYGREAGIWLPGNQVEMMMSFDLDAEYSYPAADRAVTLSINGEVLTTVLANEGHSQQVTVPATRLTAGGRNFMAFSCTECVRFGLASVRTRVAVADSARRAKWFPRGSFAEAGSIVHVPGAHLSLALWPKAGARFVADLPSASSAGAFEYSVIAETPAGEKLLLGSERNSWWRQRRFEVSLERAGNQPVRLTLRVVGRAGSGEAPGGPALWLNPRVVVPFEPEPAAQAPRVGRANIILYVIDALRADHLEPYGYARATSPRIAAFAQQGILFEHAYSQSVWTRPAVGSLLSGLYPEEHMAVNDTSSLAPSVPLVSSYLRAQGYTTVSVQANGNAGPEYGFARDFDIVIPPDPIGPGVPTWNSSARIHAKLMRLLPQLPEPYFVFVQSLDPHYPYGADGPYLRDLEGHPYRRLALREAFARWQGAHSNDREQELLTSYLVARYDGGIRHNDEYFGKLLDELSEPSRWDRTAVALTADHGEAFREHGWEQGHATLFEHTVRVPLIIKPPFWHGARRSALPVQHLDIVPTLLEWAGVAAPAQLPGSSLGSLLDHEEVSPARSLHISVHPDRQLGRFPHRGRAVVSWPYKLIHSDVRLAKFLIYDLRNDPAETTSLWDGLPPQSSVLLDTLLAEARRRPLQPSGDSSAKALSDSDVKMLKALGYLQ
jgi:arylsulfatase A-like enzyme